MSTVHLTDYNFESEILKAKTLAMVDFFATWCGPCKMMAPVIERLADSYGDKVKIGKLDVDENGKTSELYEIQSIPTLVFFKNGEVVEKLIGFQSEETLKTKFMELM